MRKGRRESPGGDIRHFTNRLSELATFRRLADGSAGTPLPVVMFYGVGGTGKSWLARRLQQEAHDRLGLPTARLDFDPNAGGAGMHSDSVSALAEIQRQLGISCPRFELAYAMMLHKQGVKDEPKQRHAGKVATAWELAGEFVNAALEDAKTFLPSNVLVWFGKKLGEAAIGPLKESALGQWVISRAGYDDLLILRRMTAQEIYPLLAERLAEDLEEHLPRRADKACRAVVFLDTFEALKVGAQSGTGHHYAHEAWVCRFYEQLSSVLLVLSGRDRLTWDEVDGDWRDPRYLEQYSVTGLSETDARCFLAECEITEPRLQQAVLAVCVDTETPGTEIAYHPFSLGLCTDTIASAWSQGNEPDPQSFRMPPGDYDALAARFLRSLPPNHEAWVLHLALTPRFDEAAAKAAYARTVGGEVHHAWDILLDFSFLRPGEQTGWHTLHPRMRDALRTRFSRNSTAEQPAHEAWRIHWQSRSETEADDPASLAWYHLWRLDSDSALATWNSLVEASRLRLEMVEHYSLLAWWTPTNLERQKASSRQEGVALNNLGIELCKTSLGNREVNLGRAIVCFRSALHVYKDNGLVEYWAGTQNNLGGAYMELPSGDRIANLSRAIACYQETLRICSKYNIDDQWAKTQSNLGEAFRNLPTGDRAENIRRAIACYEEALRVHTESAAPIEWAGIQNNLGMAYQDLRTGDRSGNLRHAIECYEAALRIYAEGVSPVDWAGVKNNLGTAYAELPTGDQAENLSHAIKCYEDALCVRTEQDFPHHWAMTQGNLGIAYQHLNIGDRTENLRRAIGYHEVASRICTERDYPLDWGRTRFNMGLTYLDLEDRAGAAAAFEDAARGFRTIGHEQFLRMAEDQLAKLRSDEPGTDPGA